MRPKSSSEFCIQNYSASFSYRDTYNPLLSILSPMEPKPFTRPCSKCGKVLVATSESQMTFNMKTHQAGKYCKKQSALVATVK